MKNVLFLFVAGMVLAGCGGSSSDGGGTGGSSAVTVLQTVNGFGIVPDIEPIDLNDDGLMDLVMARTGDDPFYAGCYLQALINNGDRTFTDQTDLYFPNIGTDWKWIEKIYFADLNGDLRLDLVGHTDQGANLLPPLIRQVDGTFAPIDPSLLSATGSLIPFDADNDGDIDLINHGIDNWADPDTQIITWTLFENTLSQTGTMGFQLSSAVIDNTSRAGTDYCAFPMAPVVADINQDDLPDLFYSGPIWKDGFVDEVTPVTVLLNSASGDFAEATSSVFDGPVPELTHLRDTATADFNGDGLTDILLANTGYDWDPWPGQRNLILFQQEEGTLRVEEGTAETLNYKGFTHSADVGDIDNDGDVDIVFTDMLGDDVGPTEIIRILINDGTGNFTRRTSTIPAGYMLENNWVATRLVDLDNDGYPELVLGGHEAASDSLIFWNREGVY